MNPILFNLYGPLNINSYGVMIALGVIIFMWRCLQTKPAWLSNDQLTASLTYGIFGGIIGGRLMTFLTNPEQFPEWLDVFKIWLGGFSVLGAALGILAALYLFTKKNHIPFLALMDLFALNAGILQSISRIGCFFAGCCCGMPTSVPWAVIYTNEHSLAPLCTPLHPVQLYSAILFLLLFLGMQFLKPFLKKDGLTIMVYLFFMGIIRFSLDFIRADRNIAYGFWHLSIDQIIALGVSLIALLFLIFLIASKKVHDKSI